MPFRDIKFRDYCPESKTITYFDLDTYNKYDNDCYGNATQYSGVQDRNGKDIYEGDIIKICSIDDDSLFDLYILTFVNMFEPKLVLIQSEMNHKKREIGYSFSVSSFEVKRYEVIGNVYENKDLLYKDANIHSIMLNNRYQQPQH